MLIIEFKDCQMHEGLWARVYGYDKDGVYRVRQGSKMEFWVRKDGAFRNFGGFPSTAFNFFHQGRETSRERAARLAMFAY